MAELAKAKRRRASILGLLTQLARQIDEDQDGQLEQDHSTVQVRLSLLEDYFKRYMQVEESILDLEPIEEDETDDETLEPSQSMLRFHQAYATIKSRLLASLKIENDSKPNISMNNNTVSVKLPRLNLPTFSGTITEYVAFKNEFESMIGSNESLSDIEKFRYLRSTLKGEAKKLIENLEISEANYKPAWELLEDRYGDDALIFQSHIEKLMKLQPVLKESGTNLHYLIDQVQAHVRSLLSLGNNDQLADNLLICMLLQKIDSKTRLKWDEESSKKIPTYKEFIEFLERRASALGKSEVSSDKPFASFSTNTKAVKSVKNVTLVSRPSTNAHCLKCQTHSHSITVCPILKALPVDERIEEIKKLKICIKCLKQDHNFRRCRATCKNCHKNHHILLHSYDLPPHIDKHLTPSSSRASLNKSLITSLSFDDEPAILASAQINIIDSSEKSFRCRAILDCGSTNNYISEIFAKRLNIKKKKTSSNVEGISETLTKSRECCNIKIKSQFTDEVFQLTVNILPKITSAYPPSSIDTSKWVFPKDCALADSSFAIPHKVDLLIGAGLFWHLLLPRQRSLGQDLPLLQETKLGWIVVGPVQSTLRPRALSIVQRTVQEDEQLNELVQRFWDVDTLHPSEIPQKPQDQACEDHYALNTRRDSSGRYVVRLPFRAPPSKLGESLDIAMRRFINLERKLSKDPTTKAQYTAFIDEYKELGHLEIVSGFDFSVPHYFLPHHCVLKPSSSSTKLRVVFDASCKTSNGVSLNDILYTGPKLQSDLMILLLRFRLHRYVITADICKMYRQIIVNKPDDNFQLILWRSDTSQPIQVLRLRTVTYGTASGSYLAIKSLHQLAEDECHNFPEAAKILRQDFYVDDAMFGSNCKLDLENKLKQLHAMLKLGGLTLSKHCSNDLEILKSIPDKDKEKFMSIDENNVIKTLGLIWQPDADVFRFTYSESEVLHAMTKRTVLSEIAKLFDPLGFICPVITLAKIFYQELWKLKLDWDTRLSPKVADEWNNFRLQLPELKKISLPRYVMDLKDVEQIELHGFSDASEKAYGACVYVRSTHSDNSITVHLLQAKSRVAPTKTITIARLELLAAELLSGLVSRLRREVFMETKIDQISYWTDSSIVLCWLKAEPYNWSTFVSHRVAKIQERDLGKWRHVASDLNPADLLSRGTFPIDIIKSKLWWNGPNFLYEKEACWPSSFNVNDIEISEERRASKITLTTIATLSKDITTSMHFSVDFRGIRRVFVLVRRFIDRCRQASRANKTSRNFSLPLSRKYQMPMPSLEEEEEAERWFIKSIQMANFPQEYRCLQANRNIPADSKLKTLSPFLDDHGIIRVGGRLKYSNMKYDAKHQILLPAQHRYTRSILHYFHHYRSFHGGPNLVLSAARSRYWPINGLRLAKSIAHSCLYCFRARPKFVKQMMAPLPADRVNYQNLHPFSVTGIDFAGYFKVKHHARCKVEKKVYAALFICFLTKAVHIELVQDLSEVAFLRALQRFVADRGGVKKIYSDNAKNFIGASNHLKEIRTMLKTSQSFIQQALARDVVEWSFIPPRTPSFGGLWESSIKIMKRLLVAAIGDHELTEDEFCTYLKKVAAIMNSRPITPMSSDPNDLEPLTPSHFLYGHVSTGIPESSSLCDITPRRRWQHTVLAANHYWSRFHKEYLSALQKRYTCQKPAPPILPDMMVLLKDDFLPSLKWSIGRIVEVKPGKDGLVRVVKVKTSNGMYERGLNGIAILPEDFQCQTIVERTVQRGEPVEN